VIFGAGQIGTPLASLLRDRGHPVRIARRSGGGPEGIEVRHGDAGDPAFATDAAKAASVIYHCMNPAYDSKVWARELPRLMDALISAAARAGARLVVLDNLYLFGRPAGQPLNEDSPVNPCSRKGEIRAQVNQRLMAAHARGDVRAVVARGSDYYGPRGVATYFGDAFWPEALKSGRATLLVNPEPPHTYHYTLDVAAGLAALGDASDDVTGRWWMLPAAPAESTRAMVARLGKALGRELRPRRMPPWLIGLGGRFVPILRELAEMGYQWEEPFVTDDRRFRERFGTTPTPLDEGARATVEWALRHYGNGPRPGSAGQAGDPRRT
jgi:nucleoside-diphosphate-sugar epimerase